MLPIFLISYLLGGIAFVAPDGKRPAGP